jgi:membrane associated rhomboid family serine protease
VIHLLILTVVAVAGALYFMTPEERTRVRGIALVWLHDARDAVTLQGPQCEEFLNVLRERTRRVIITPGLIVLSTIATLISWNGQATSGDFSHVFATTFAHTRLLDLVINSVCLLQVGLILERLVGRLAFTTVYIASGIVAGVVSFALSPDGMHGGASGSVLGMYGLLLITAAWSAFRRSGVAIPLSVAKRIVPVAAVFVLYHLTTSGLEGAAKVAALVSGLVAGTVVAREISERTPPIRRLATAMTTMVAVVMLYGLVVMHQPTTKHTTDVRPEIDRVIAVEHRTAGIYDQAVGSFRKGRINTLALVTVIHEAIVPELQSVTARLEALRDVPAVDRPLVAAVEEFLKLRDESWQLRAAALLKGDIMALRLADKKEQDSMEAFQRMKIPRTPGGG